MVNVTLNDGYFLQCCDHFFFIKLLSILFLSASKLKYINAVFNGNLVAASKLKMFKHIPIILETMNQTTNGIKKNINIVTEVSNM